MFSGERAVMKFILVDSFLDLSAFYVLPPMYQFNLDVPRRDQSLSSLVENIDLGHE